ncbi:uncharacterized protein TRIADDRAFT_51883 [Trichoplax adhaerens]|uniref:Phosphorylated adapter RNA export protein n=1 Tax=Trichoplax adhaerens TaxID=10228 RepID=B3RL54_TRIAD|nr:hypothetical protein TRIADDRAFT_51883 [Trichoplax adhaerens]EDV28704.1 hypothetical protein TRIADDRAFT_51883 [Trichoplax adhaerens]|eukprot:XP_002107906.1 hypothetical protein TRIADDRAFT_51883 [Trichoplax adhaerens]
MDLSDILEPGEISDDILTDAANDSYNIKDEENVSPLVLNQADFEVDYQDENTDEATLPKLQEKHQKRHQQNCASESEESSSDEDKAWQRKKHKTEGDVTNTKGALALQSKVLPADWLQLDLLQKFKISNDRIAKSIAHHLHEPKVQLVQDVVNMIGVEKALLLTRFTLAIQKGGGMLTKDGKRKRYPGGVFLYLLGSAGIIEDATYKEIIKRDRQRQKYAKAQYKERNDKS